MLDVELPLCLIDWVKKANKIDLNTLSRIKEEARHNLYNNNLIQTDEVNFQISYSKKARRMLENGRGKTIPWKIIS